MKILGIETSCDETAAAVVEDGHTVLANVVSSQVQQHAAYGGVVPELAAREHLKAIDFIVRQTLEAAGCTADDLAAVAVTHTPGLLPALLVGVNYAKGMAAGLGCPLIGINHFTAHIFGAFLDRPDLIQNPDAYPVAALVVSGGHTALVLIDETGRSRIVGQTLDDAAGEAFDKAAKILHLGYPGGPIVDRIAKEGNPKAIKFPRGLTGGGGTPLEAENRHNFSFSGVKTALLYHVKSWPPAAGEEAAFGISQQQFRDTIASYQEAIVDVLKAKAVRVARDYQARTLVVCGGVACNSRLRHLITKAAGPVVKNLLIAPPKYCTDNGSMIAGLAHYVLKQGLASGHDLDAVPRNSAEHSWPCKALKRDVL